MPNNDSQLVSPSPLSPKLRNLEYTFENTKTVECELKEPPLRRRGSLDVFKKKRRTSTHMALAKTAVGTAHLGWDKTPKKVLIVCKLQDDLIQMALDSARWLMEINMTRELVNESPVPDSPSEESSRLQFWDADFSSKPESDLIDFVITLGGDGTVLFAAWLFQKKVPPIIPFNLGSLGFMTEFDYSGFKTTIQKILDADAMRMNFRMRFQCTVHRKHLDEDHGKVYQILNDVVIDRGPSPYLSQLELFGNDQHITTVQADGLVIASPTGSTAYSLSAGGAVVHPQVSAILVTPICPHTLSFRPMILPDTMDIRICVPNDSRATAWVSFDGRHRVQLNAGDAVQVMSSPFPVPTVCKIDQTADWFNGLERCLGWNKRQRQKQLKIVERDES
ncbi:ATP-NAD kinase-like domain-containing protein [Gorgonomyces haynaldii]|nr:ATP-NAD kinase-like domain-containing protein [Gorgonomyces haynaldii]